MISGTAVYIRLRMCGFDIGVPSSRERVLFCGHHRVADLCAGGGPAAGGRVFRRCIASLGEYGRRNRLRLAPGNNRLHDPLGRDDFQIDLC